MARMPVSNWPDFLIVGAPRSGTTSLYQYLRRHPLIYMPANKEPHFFCEIDIATHVARRGSLPGMLITEEDAYLRLFEGAAPEQTKGEATAAYLSDEAAPSRISLKIPEAKIIVVLREPIDRAHSDYLFSVRQGKERERSFYEALQEDHKYLLESCGQGSFYIQRGLYYQQLRRYFHAFGRHQVRVYLYEDLASDTIGVLRDICTFLGVPPDHATFTDTSTRYNSYGSPRNTLISWASRRKTIRSLASSVLPMELLIPLRDRLLSRTQPKPPLEPRARGFLKPIFDRDILKVQELIQRDLTTWLS